MRKTAFILLLNLRKKEKKSLRTNTLEPKTVEYTHKKREKMEEQNGNQRKADSSKFKKNK